MEKYLISGQCSHLLALSKSLAEAEQRVRDTQQAADQARAVRDDLADEVRRISCLKPEVVQAP